MIIAVNWIDPLASCCNPATYRQRLSKQPALTKNDRCSWRSEFDQAFRARHAASARHDWQQSRQSVLIKVAAGSRFGISVCIVGE
ncbi:MAG: hypothetical protein JWM11_1202 [Planctomycetaceae bacterium]|nr:hypothetical protein [Planctomycetaceae bacterium]